MAMLKTRAYVQLLVLAALIGVPVSALAYGYLKLVTLLQTWFFTSMPKELGYTTTPVWWPLPSLGVAGVLVALDHHLPTRHRRPRAGRGDQGGRCTHGSRAARGSSWPRWSR